MKRARRMCKSCPFRGASEEDRFELAVVDPEAWPCHTEHPHGGGDTQCRGHFEARRKYPVLHHETMRWKAWVKDHDFHFGCEPMPNFRDPA